MPPDVLRPSAHHLPEVGFLHIRETGQIGYLALYMFDEEYGVVRKDSFERFGPFQFLTTPECGCGAKG